MNNVCNRFNVAMILIGLSTSIGLFGCAAPGTQRVSINDAAVKSEELKQQKLALEEIMAEQTRLITVAWPLLTKGSSICREDVRPAMGFYAMTKPKGANGGYLTEKYGIKEKPTIYFIVPGSPAEKARLKLGDVLEGINGKAVENIESMEEAISTWGKGQNIQLKISRLGTSTFVDVSPVVACKYKVGLTLQQIINAFADGNRVMIARGMMSFAKTDNELALVIAHEIAHNSMRHIDAKKQNMGLGLLADIAVVLASRGRASNPGFANIGASAYSQEFEAEADYVGLYLMANAGLPISDAPKFWRRMAAAHPKSIKTNHSATHPSTAYRMIALEETVKEIQGKIDRNETLVPNMKDGKLFVPSAN